MFYPASRSHPHRPNVIGTRHAIAAGHYLAAQAGFLVLEGGGNAIDAGVAAGITMNVVESQMCCFGGVAPIMIYSAERNEVITISGLGTWPKAASCEYFRTHHNGEIPKDLSQTVVPGAPDAWVTALEEFGTISFAEAAAAAIRFARDGFPIDWQMAHYIEQRVDDFNAWPSSAAVFLPNGRPLRPGELLAQVELAQTLQFLADEEAAAAAKGGRKAGLKAVRDAVYRGDIAATIVRFMQDNGGLLSAEDMAGFRAAIESPVSTRFGDLTVYSCGPWCQGPMLLQELALVRGFDLKGLGHNSPEYVHVLLESIKLAAADREAYYGDPRFVEVPMDELLSESYAIKRRKMIDPEKAWPDLPPPGAARAASGSRRQTPQPLPEGPRQWSETSDTTYVCVVDREGNAVSITPSDGDARRSPVVPGFGSVVSPRGNQSFTDPEHPASVAPGKRPRLTPNPSMAIREGRIVMPFGSPGGDLQTQVMLQALLNIAVFGMDPQTAVEAPRFASLGFPDSFSPHAYRPGLAKLERPIAKKTKDALQAKGHLVEWWPDGPVSGTGVSLIAFDKDEGILTGAADHRRPSAAIGW